MTPDELRKWADSIREDSVIPRLVVAENVRIAADAWEFSIAFARLLKQERDDAEKRADDLDKSYEVLRSGVRSLWHGVVDGDMDRISTGYALKELFR